MTPFQVMLIVVGLGAVLMVITAVDMWRHHRGGFWAGAGFSTGGALCWCTAWGFDYVAWLPDLWGISRGSGYAAGLGLAVVAFIGGALHR